LEGIGLGPVVMIVGC